MWKNLRILTYGIVQNPGQFDFGERASILLFPPFIGRDMIPSETMTSTAGPAEADVPQKRPSSTAASFSVVSGLV